MAGKIFISYRREDTAWFATALFLRLEPKFPEDLFMDVEGIGAGQDFTRVIEKQVKACDVMLVLIGPNWLTARDEAGRRRLDSPEDFVRIEVESALHLGKRVIPVLEPKTEMPRALALPESLKDLARRNAVGLTHERFEADVQGFIRRSKMRWPKRRRPGARRLKKRRKKLNRLSLIKIIVIGQATIRTFWKP